MDTKRILMVAVASACAAGWSGVALADAKAKFAADCAECHEAGTSRARTPRHSPTRSRRSRPAGQAQEQDHALGRRGHGDRHYLSKGGSRRIARVRPSKARPREGAGLRFSITFGPALVSEKILAVRALFCCCWLVNLLFAAWSLWVAPVPAVAGLAAPAASGPGTIRLLRELPAPSPPADAGLAALDDASLACVSVGLISTRGGRARRGTSRGTRLRGPAARGAGRGAGRPVGAHRGARHARGRGNAQAALQAAGLTEAYLVTDEQAGTVVSLGVHSDAARAESMVAAARSARLRAARRRRTAHRRRRVAGR